MRAANHTCYKDRQKRHLSLIIDIMNTSVTNRCDFQISNHAGKNICLHCGLLIQEKSPWADNSDNNSNKNFCCSGCKIIYETINRLGLGDYYKLNIIELTPSFKKRLKRDKSFAWLDSEKFLSSHARKISELLSGVTLSLSGIHCTGCVWLLENIPGTIDGIDQIKVNLTRGEIKILYNPQRIKLSKIGELLYSLGYDVHSLNETRSSRQKLAYKSLQLKLGVAAFCALNTMMLAVSFFQAIYTGMPDSYATFFRWTSLLLTLPAVIYCAKPFYNNSIISLKMHKPHIDQPISVAIIAGFILSCTNTLLGNANVYYDSVCSLIFLLLAGRYLQQLSLEKYLYGFESNRNLIPETAVRKIDATTSEVPTADLEEGDIIIVGNNQILPVDGKVISNSALIDNSIITGESTPLKIAIGCAVYAGSLNKGETIEILTKKTGDATKIASLIKESEKYRDFKSAASKLSEKAAGYFVLFSAFAALCCFLYWLNDGLQVALNTSLSVLIVTCPCALGIATPTALALAFQSARKYGIIIKNPDIFEILSKARNLYLDKTGTITNPYPVVKYFRQFESNDIKPIVKSCIAHSQHHPLSLALGKWLSSCEEFSSQKILPALLEPGKGLIVDDCLYIGSKKWFDSFHISISKEQTSLFNDLSSQGLSLVLIWNNFQLYAVFGIENSISHDTVETINKLKSLFSNLIILSGDHHAAVARTAELINISKDNAFGELAPEAKAQIISTSEGISVMAGDGFNDSLALAAADVGIGIKGGLEAAFSSSDVYITDGKLSTVYRLIQGSKVIFKKIRMTLLISILYNLTGLSLAVCGLINPLIAALIMPASSVTSLLVATSGNPFKLKNE